MHEAPPRKVPHVLRRCLYGVRVERPLVVKPCVVGVVRRKARGGAWARCAARCEPSAASLCGGRRGRTHGYGRERGARIALAAAGSFATDQTYPEANVRTLRRRGSAEFGERELERGRAAQTVGTRRCWLATRNFYCRCLSLILDISPVILHRSGVFNLVNPLRFQRRTASCRPFFFLIHFGPLLLRVGSCLTPLSLH